MEKGFRKSGSRATVILYGGKEEHISDLHNAKRVWSSCLYPFEIYKQILKDRPSILHIQFEFTTFGPFWTNLLLPILLILTKVANVKTVVTVHSVIPKEMVDKDLMRQLLPQIARFGFSRILLKLFLIFLYGMLVLSADEIIVHGKWYEKELLSSYKATASKIHVIPYGIEEQGSVNEALLNEWRRRFGERKVILFFGNISPRKDIETLIRSFAIFSHENHGYLLVIAGGEPPYYKWYSDRLKSSAKELGLLENTLFTGPISDEEIHILYRLSEFVVFPYLYGFEGPSGPLAFAIQYSLPIVGTNVGHLAEEICNLKEGILVPPRDVKAFSEAMAKLANDKGLRNSLSKNLKRKTTGMFWADVATKTYQLYKDSLTRSSAPNKRKTNLTEFDRN